MQPRVMISNATRLHAHHHAYALQQAGMLLAFHTSIWNKPERWPGRMIDRLPARVARPFKSFLAKRHHRGLRSDLVQQHWGLEVLRIVADVLSRGRFRDRLLFVHKGAYDRAVARRVKTLKPDVVVGFEISCEKTFASARQAGAVTVLDLAGLHHDFTAGIAAGHGTGLQSPGLARRLRARKQQELAQADHILTISHLARDVLIEQGVDPARISVVRLGVALDTFRPKPDEDRSGPFRLLYVGNLSRAKGVDKLLAAFTELDLPNAELVLVGSHVERAFLAPYEGRYTHIPYLAHAELAEQYRRADVLVLPTLFDSWGMVVTEAMASGTPVIVTGNCGAKEVVSPDCGWIVEPGDVSSLKHAIADAFSDRRRLAEMGRRAREAVEPLHWDAYHRDVAARIDAVWRANRGNLQGSGRRIGGGTLP